MDKKPLIVGSIGAVILLILGSLSNVIGYQTVQTSQRNIIVENINQKNLLFQTILDIANNKEIQRITLNSQINRGVFSLSAIPILTKNHLKQMYFIGSILSKFISTSKVQSIVGTYQFSNQETQKEISAIIENDSALRGEITQLKNSECDCENEDTTSVWKFPILCTTLFILMFVLIYAITILSAIFGGPIGGIFIEYFFLILSILSVIYHEYLDCPWPYYP